MPGVKISHGRRTAIGTIHGMLAQGLVVPTGLLTAAFLTRRLGPELYGLLTVSAGIVLWIEMSVTWMFTRTTVKFVAEAEDWRAVAATIIRTEFFISLAAALGLVAAAPVLASWLGSPELKNLLRLYSLDIPLIALALAHRSTLIGKGAFGQRAVTVAVRWLTRMLLVFILVGLGLSVEGAILAAIGGGLASLLVARYFVRPPLFGRLTFPVRRLWGYVLPLFFYDIGLHLFNRLDLLMVKALGETAKEAGYFGAAQNLTIVLGLIAASFTPLLLSTLSQMLRDGQVDHARDMATQSLRFFLCLLPLAGVVAGSASEIVTLVYGGRFHPAGPLAAVLVFSYLGLTLISLNTVILTASGQPGWTTALTIPLPILGFFLHLWLIPRYGAISAAYVTAVLSYIAGGAASLLVYRKIGAYPPLSTLVKVLLTTGVIYYLTRAWNLPGLWVVLKLAVMTAASLFCLMLLREVTRKDVDFFRSLTKG